jgi:hypothetical protein
MVLHLGTEFVFIVEKHISFSRENLATFLERFLPEESTCTGGSSPLSMAWKITDSTSKLNLIVLEWQETEHEVKFYLNFYLKPEHEPQPAEKFKGEDWYLDLAQQFFLHLKARLAVGGSSGVAGDIDLSSTETLGLGVFQGALLMDGLRYQLLQEFCQYSDNVPTWSERRLGEAGCCLVWPGWFGEAEINSLEPILRLPWEIDPPSFDDSVGGQYDFLSVASFGVPIRLTDIISHTYRFLEDTRDFDISLDCLPNGMSLRIYAATVLNFMRINRFFGDYDEHLLSNFEHLLTISLDELISNHNFLKLSICWARVAYFKGLFGNFQIYYPRYNEHKDARVLLLFPLGEDKFDYSGEAWQWIIIERLFKVFDLEWCAGSVGSTIYLDSKSIFDANQINRYPFTITKVNKRLEFRIDKGWFGTVSN